MSIGQSKVRQGGSFWRDWGIVVGGLNDIGNGSSDFKAQCSLVNKYVMTNFIANISNSM